MLAAVERAVSGTAELRNDAAARIDALEAALRAEANAAPDPRAASWLEAQAEGLRRGCPAAQVVAYCCARSVALSSSPAPNERMRERRLHLALATELAANSVLSARSDFIEGASCAVGLRKGETPLWQHASRQEAASDPSITRLVACALSQREQPQT